MGCRLQGVYFQFEINGMCGWEKIQGYIAYEPLLCANVPLWQFSRFLKETG